MASENPKRVYYHETADVCDGLPALLRRFPLRALLVAKPGERVVLPDGFGPPTELPLLNRLGFGPREEDLIFVREDGSIASGDGDLEGATILPFSGTTMRARTFAQKHGATFHAPSHDACLAANSKAVFQQIVNDAFFRTGRLIGPRGLVADRSEAESLVEEMTRLSYGKVIVKGPHSASGLQQVIVSRGERRSLEGMPETVVIQEWVEHTSSPSALCLANEHGGGFLNLCSTEQILEGTHHIGNRSPSLLDPATYFWKSDEIMRAVARGLERIGFWGYYGIDFLVDEQRGTMLANEVNARIPAPWYPWQASRRRYDKPMPFRMKSVALRTGTTIDDVERAAGRRLLYGGDPVIQLSGFVPFCFVPEHGFLHGVTYANDASDLDSLAKRIDARLSELAP